MRVYSKRQFVELPAGTLYHPGVKWLFGDLTVKGRSRGDDWYGRPLGWVTAHDNGEAFDRLEEMVSTGASYPLDQSYAMNMRDEDDTVFLVYEAADLDVLSAAVEGARICLSPAGSG